MTREDFLILLTRKFTAELSSDEESMFQEVVKDNDSYARYAQELTRYFQTVNQTATSTKEKLDDLWRRIDQLEPTAPLLPKKNSITRRNWLRIAALVVFSLGVTLFLYYYFTKANDLLILRAGTDKCFVTLEDGTQISLNKTSSIRYNRDFGVSSRTIFLEGEAFFDVPKNVHVPLVVHVGNVLINVMGTAFNVKANASADSLEIALIRGAIEVANASKKDKKVLLKPNEKLIITPNAQSENSDYRLVSMQFPELAHELKWTQDSLVFKKQELKDLIVQMEKKYQVKIAIKNEALKHKRFSGSFTETSLKEALEALQISYPFHYSIKGQLVVIE